jgi:hypothetical protein
MGKRGYVSVVLLEMVYTVGRDIGDVTTKEKIGVVQQ